MSRTLRGSAFLAVLAFVAVLSACSGGSSSATPAATAAAAKPTSAATAAATTAAATPAASKATAAATTASAGGSSTVDVTLGEWSVKADQTSVPAGKVDFKVKNGGTVAHELVVVQTDLAPDKLPVKGSAVDTTAVTVAGTLTQFDAGQTKDLTVDLKPGHYVLICNLPGHYQLGMHTELTVK